MTTPDTTQLHQFLVDRFNLDELKTLCLNLKVRYDDLGGEGLTGKARELVLFLERTGRLVDLRAVLAQLRPDSFYATFGDAAAEQTITATSPRRRRRYAERNPRQIFVSHAVEDGAAFAHRLANDLRRAGYSIWIAPESNPQGQWVSAINRGLAESGVILLVLTSGALESPWVEMETNVAIELERAGEVRFIPVCLERGRYEPTWHAYQWVMFDQEYHFGLETLLERLNDKRAIEGQQSTYPSLKEIPGKKTLSKRQQDIYRFIQAYMREHERAPTMREIGRAVGITSASVVNYNLGKLEDKGYLARSVLESREGYDLSLTVRDPGNWPSPRIHEKTGIELVRIPAGPFLYGSADSDELAYDDEKPQRTINLPEYWIGRAPVTNAQFARFMKATGHRTTAEIEGKGRGWTGSMWDWIDGADWRHPRGPKSSIVGKDDHPVVQVSWDDAQAFCDWAGLALPVEEQWEKAARGTDGRVWPWGNEPPTAEHCNFNRNVDDTTPVGKYSPRGDSPYGCVDMTGNVWEWSASWYTEGSTRALRGGSWYDGDHESRAAFRGVDGPHYRYYHVGFRVAELLSDPGF